MSLDELDFWLLAAIDAGYSFAVGQAPLPLNDAGIEQAVARALAAWKARMGYVDDIPWHRPAWLQALAEPAGVEPGWEDRT